MKSKDALDQKTFAKENDDYSHIFHKKTSIRISHIVRTIK